MIRHCFVLAMVALSTLSACTDKSGVMTVEVPNSPLTVYASTAPYSAEELLGLSLDVQKAIFSALPPVNFLVGHSGMDSFSHGLVLGTISRARINGFDFAVIEGNVFVPNRPESTLIAAAEMSGCRYNGYHAISSASHFERQGIYKNWFVGLNCEANG